MSSDTHLRPISPPVHEGEDYLPDDDVLIEARARAIELGCTPPSIAAGCALRFLVAALRAKAVVEIGADAGVSGLYLLRGMPDDGVLTSIDAEPEHNRIARGTFLTAGYPAGRVRLITGRALDVLPRLTTGGYDLVFIDADRMEYPGYYEHGVHLLRRGGVIVFHNVLNGGGLTDPTRRDPESLALRELARSVRDDERLASTILPAGNGLLAAALR